jgi:hypothetical protein
VTPSERQMRARLGAYAQHARYDGVEITSKARAAFLARFENEVDPDRQLEAGERRRRADAAKRAHFTRMALRSAQSRRKAAS